MASQLALFANLFPPRPIRTRCPSCARRTSHPWQCSRDCRTAYSQYTVRLQRRLSDIMGQMQQDARLRATAPMRPLPVAVVRDIEAGLWHGFGLRG